MIRSALRRLTGAACLLGVLALSGTVSAETLLIERVHETAGIALPEHGMSMAQVQARFGAPASRLAPRGGQRSAWPVIHRWQYPAFTVYFENDKVIDAVANRSGQNEIGPKPAIR